MKIFSVCKCTPGTGILGPRATVAVLRRSCLVSQEPPQAVSGQAGFGQAQHSTYSLCLIKQFKVCESQVKLSKSKQTESGLSG